MKISDKIFNIQSDENFNKCAIEVFKHQAIHTKIYQQFLQLLNVNTSEIKHYTQIPFLPIQFFKTQKIITTGSTPEIIFSSSGTTGTTVSKHLVADLDWYKRSFQLTFQQFYGNTSEIAVLALLPSYLERSGSSLIYMVEDLITNSRQSESNFFLYNHHELFQTLNKLKKVGKKTILFGVTYALLDFLENYKINFPNLIVMETGGMKGKRKEMVREELHAILCKGFGVKAIHSEYGMTELLSQGYSTGHGLFLTPNWLKVLIRDPNDPLSIINEFKTGAINVIDLANYNSCSFIATQDLGKQHADGSFEILGRFDNSDIRGCNLLVQ